MNKQGPGKIDWTDQSWNPIKGLCPEACWYCYARRMYLRFGLYGGLEGGEETEAPDVMHGDVFLAEWALKQKLPKKPSKIFVCSTFELFNPRADAWRDEIFAVIEAHPEHTFQVLTKRPERIDRPMPDNVWLGVSVTRNEDLWRIHALREKAARIKFVSFEPLFDDWDPKAGGVRWGSLCLEGIDGVIVGRLTGRGRKYDPSLTTVEWVVENARNAGAAVWLKDSLKEIWPGGIWPGRLPKEWPGERR